MKKLLLAALLVVPGLIVAASPAAAKSDATYKADCRDPFPLCAEVANPQEAFGNYYVGHDEPSLEFYSSTPGSGNHAQFQLTIPIEPSGSFTQSKGYDFELHPAFWFGMAMCDTQSYPEQVPT